MRGERIAAERRADALHLVRSDAHADACPADEDRIRRLTLLHQLAGLLCKIRIITGLFRVCPAIYIFDLLFVQMLHKRSLECKPTVITRYSNFHNLRPPWKIGILYILSIHHLIAKRNRSSLSSCFF
ncbi:Uncharacterised protein [Bacteroides xylanisolvens]|nr:Uncharacterised protein [Bacteroides xylanisolvens]